MLESYTPNPQVESSLRTELRDDDCATRHRPRELHYGRIWSPERDEQLIALYTAVPPPKDLALAEAMGMRVSQVRGRLDVLRAAGVLSPRPKKAERKRRDAPPPTADDLRTALKARASALWPTERLLTLCLGWRAGEKTAALATRLGITNNAVVGAVHRLVARGILEARPSLVIRDADDPRRTAEPHARRTIPVPAATLPPLASGNEPPAMRPASPPRFIPAPAPPPPPPSRPYARITECCWPIGEVGTRGFRFCDAPTEPGRPYCEEHAMKAFVRVRPSDRADDYARPGA